MKSQGLLGILTSFAFIFGSFASPAMAWWDAGHMQIA